MGVNSPWDGHAEVLSKQTCLNPPQFQLSIQTLLDPLMCVRVCVCAVCVHNMQGVSECRVTLVVSLCHVRRQHIFNRSCVDVVHFGRKLPPQRSHLQSHVGSECGRELLE